MNKKLAVLSIACTVLIVLGSLNTTFFYSTDYLTSKIGYSYSVLAALDWWDCNWSYCKKIIIDHTKVDADLTNFPVLIYNSSDTDLRDHAQTDGDDIAFVSNDNLTQYDHEIEYYDSSTGNIVAWVEIPSLSSTEDTILYMYYGNPTCTSQENISGTWDSHYVMVQHLNETSGTHYDSTSYGNDGTQSGGVNQSATGKIDGADWFDGNDDYINCGNDNSLNLTNQLTLEAWVRDPPTTKASSPSNALHIVKKQNDKQPILPGQRFSVQRTISCDIPMDDVVFACLFSPDLILEDMTLDGHSILDGIYHVGSANNKKFEDIRQKLPQKHQDIGFVGYSIPFAIQNTATITLFFKARMCIEAKGEVSYLVYSKNDYDFEGSTHWHNLFAPSSLIFWPFSDILKFIFGSSTTPKNGAEEPSVETNLSKFSLVERNATWNKYYNNKTGEYRLCSRLGACNYKDDAGWHPINTTLVSSRSSWDWEMTRADYKAYFKNSLTSGMVARYESDGKYIELQPMTLQFSNELDQIQQISMPHDVLPTTKKNAIMWTDAYGKGLDFKWTCYNTELAKLLIIDNLSCLPEPDEDKSVLELNLRFRISNDIDIYVNGEKWDKKTAVDTKEYVSFKDSDGKILWYFKPAWAWDSNSDILNVNRTLMTVRLEQQGGELYVSLRLDYSWLRNATFPVYVDANVNKQISNTNDDAWEQGNNVFYYNNNDYVQVFSYGSTTNSLYRCGGTRFQGITIPQGSTITDAKVNVYVPSTTYDDPRLKIYAENTSNSVDFATTQDIIDSRVRTNSYKQIQADSIGIGWHTANVTSPVWEVINRSDWISGHSITLLWIGMVTALHRLVFNAYHAGNAPWLNITYTVDTTPPEITINFAGNLSDYGGPWYRPPGEDGVSGSTQLTGDFANGYYTNDSRQQEDWMYINLTVTDVSGVDEVWLHWYNQSDTSGNGWTNNSYQFTHTGGNYWEYNTSGNIPVAPGCNYSFDIWAKDTKNNVNVTWWNKTGQGSGYTRRYVQLNHSPTDITYANNYAFYFYQDTDKASYGSGDVGAKDILHHDQGGAAGGGAPLWRGVANTGLRPTERGAPDPVRALHHLGRAALLPRHRRGRRRPGHR